MQANSNLKEFFTKEMLERDYDGIHSTNKIADKYGVSKKTILNYKNRFGIEKIRITVPVDIVRSLAEKGLSSPEIGSMLGFTQSAISKAGKKNGIKITDTFHKGYVVTDSGYKMIRVPDHPYCDKKGYVREHRLVMEEYLGRILDPYELVHHINRDRGDNRIENLELVLSAEHAKHHHIGKKGRGPDKKPRKKALRS